MGLLVMLMFKSISKILMTMLLCFLKVVVFAKKLKFNPNSLSLFFEIIGIYYGNVTENGTAGMMVMTMTAVDYDDAEEGKTNLNPYS